MRRPLSLLLLPLVLSCVAPPAAEPPRPALDLPTSRFFRFERLADGVYAALGESGHVTANSGVVDLGGGEALIFDVTTTADAANDLVRFAEALSGGRVRYVVNSHAHFDHMGANMALPADVEIISTAATAEAVPAAVAAVLRDTIAGREYSLQALEENEQLLAGETDPDRRREWAYMVNTFRTAVLRNYTAIRERPPTTTFEGRHTIEGAERTVELHSFGGGHTEGDVVLYLPGEQIAFMGDLLFLGRHSPLFLSDVDSLLAAHAEVLRLGATTFVPGHGRLGSREDVEAFPRYVAAVRDVAVRLAERRTPADSVGVHDVPADYADLWWREMFFVPSVKAFMEQLAAPSGGG